MEFGNEVSKYRPSKLPAQFWGLSSQRLARLRRDHTQPPPKFTLKLVASLQIFYETSYRRQLEDESPKLTRS